MSQSVRIEFLTLVLILWARIENKQTPIYTLMTRISSDHTEALHLEIKISQRGLIHGHVARNQQNLDILKNYLHLLFVSLKPFLWSPFTLYLVIHHRCQYKCHHDLVLFLYLLQGSGKEQARRTQELQRDRSRSASTQSSQGVKYKITHSFTHLSINSSHSNCSGRTCHIYQLSLPILPAWAFTPLGRYRVLLKCPIGICSDCGFNSPEILPRTREDT